MPTDSSNQIEIYQTPDGILEIAVRLEHDDLWLTPQQLAALFGRDKSVISRHLSAIYKSGELDKGATVAKNATVQTEGEREVTRVIEYYNLDAIISVGYRVNSLKGTQFRIWATQRLKEHLTRGFTLNQQRFEQNAHELEQALQLVKKAASSGQLAADEGRGLVEVISRYTQTFLWLQRYDEGLLEEPEGQPGGVLPSASQAMADLNTLKAQLIARGEATHLFAHPRAEGLEGILGNLNQTVLGEPAYPTIESKAAHLLYFVVKNHPFSDGNKRSGAWLFVDFLHRNGRLLNSQGEMAINDTGLAALTLLVAESDPKQKDVLIRLIMNMLATPTK